MARDETPIRRWKVEKAEAFIEAGFYDDPWILEQVWHHSLKKTPYRRLCEAILACPKGDGAKFQDLTAEALANILDDLIDEYFILPEFPSGGGRGDIELPFRMENVSGRPLWEQWSRRYGIRSIIVEAKNWQRPAGVSAGFQTSGYLETAHRGCFGFVVSRYGFTDPEWKNLGAIANGENKLVLPLDQRDLCFLMHLKAQNKKAPDRFFRRLEMFVRRSAA